MNRDHRFMAMAAAASKKKHHRQSYRFLSTSSKDLQRDSFVTIETSDYEFTESDIWNSGNSASSAVEMRRPSSRARPKGIGGGGGISASLPVNVPDWSKILKEDYRDRSKWDDVAEDGEEDGGEGWIPPHEYLARNRMASLSVHEGVGRTLKGRDLSRVRNAIWEKIGFQD